MWSRPIGCARLPLRANVSPDKDAIGEKSSVSAQHCNRSSAAARGLAAELPTATKQETQMQPVAEPLSTVLSDSRADLCVSRPELLKIHGKVTRSGAWLGTTAGTSGAPMCVYGDEGRCAACMVPSFRGSRGNRSQVCFPPSFTSALSGLVGPSLDETCAGFVARSARGAKALWCNATTQQRRRSCQGRHERPSGVRGR